MTAPRVLKLGIAVILALRCSRASNAPPDPTPVDVASTTLDTGCRVARYVGSHTCRLGGGPEDGSQCDDFEVGRFGTRSIVRPRPDELGEARGFAVADGDAPLRPTTELAAGYPKELQGDLTILYFRSWYAGVWPKRFFLVWVSYEDKSRVKIAAWRGDRWSAPIFDHAVAHDAFPKTQTTVNGETTLLMGAKAYLLTPEGATPVPRPEAAGRPPRVARSGCTVLPRLERDDGGRGYHEAPHGIALDVTEDDGMWIHAQRDADPNRHDTQRTYFLFHAP